MQSGSNRESEEEECTDGEGEGVIKSNFECQTTQIETFVE